MQMIDNLLTFPTVITQQVTMISDIKPRQQAFHNVTKKPSENSTT